MKGKGGRGERERGTKDIFFEDLADVGTVRGPSKVVPPADADGSGVVFSRRGERERLAGREERERVVREGEETRNLKDLLVAR